ncbi:hypothetical protein X798_00492 [Onchocerca flexuosa]|uniref:Uncharacterized protein n=1 Tax=Onchocerca flexuosa TaxID=387005 RepID=A0A238C708_9BILA|nr:hypothetical protein X798_00492 [Onchocerca flexuosa]
MDYVRKLVRLISLLKVPILNIQRRPMKNCCIIRRKLLLNDFWIVGCEIHSFLNHSMFILDCA